MAWQDQFKLEKAKLVEFTGSKTFNISDYTNGVPWTNSGIVLGASQISTKDGAFQHVSGFTKTSDNIYSVTSSGKRANRIDVPSHTIADGGNLYNYITNNNYHSGLAILRMVAEFTATSWSGNTGNTVCNYGYSGDIYIDESYYCTFRFQTIYQEGGFGMKGHGVSGSFSTTRGELFSIFNYSNTGGYSFRSSANMAIFINPKDINHTGKFNISIRNFTHINDFSKVGTSNKWCNAKLEDITYYNLSAPLTNNSKCLAMIFENNK